MIKKLAVAVVFFCLILSPFLFINLKYGGMEWIPHDDIQSWIFLLSYGEIVLLGLLFLAVYGGNKSDESDLLDLKAELWSILEKLKKLAENNSAAQAAPVPVLPEAAVEVPEELQTEEEAPENIQEAAPEIEVPPEWAEDDWD